MIKNNIAILGGGLLSLILVGCGHLPSTQITPTIHSTQARVIQQPIVAYFTLRTTRDTDDAPGITDYSFTPVKDGFYRKLLGHNAAGHFWVQDFYQNNHQAQSSPFWIKDVDGLNSFDETYVEGPVTGYFENGKIAFEAHYQHYKPVGIQKLYYKNGQLASTEIIENQKSNQKLWYENGQLAAQFSIDIDDGEFQPKGEVWDQQGVLIRVEQQRIQHIDDIYDTINVQQQNQ